MYRMTRNNYPARKKTSSVPDISLPPVQKPFDWKSARKILCIDQSLNDSGAALYVDGVYLPVETDTGISVGWALTLPTRWQKQDKILAYGAWVRQLVAESSPDIIVGESHPFARGKMETSTTTLEALIGVRWITMFVAAQNSIPYTEFSTNHVKYILCGSASAPKNAIQMILEAIGVKIPVYHSKNGIINHNVCDAIAMCEVINRMQKQERMLSEYQTIVGKGRSQTNLRNL